MNPEIKTRWTGALRSGEYKQATGYLRTEDGYCCLGVLCELAVQDGIIPPARSHDHPDGGTYWEYDYEGAVLPEPVQRWAGLDDASPLVPYPGDDEPDRVAGLAELNDGNDDVTDDGPLTFTEIADLIDQHL